MAPTAFADEPATLETITPLQTGQLVVCHLKTRGLPGAKQLQTMRSGLESAVELRLALVDENDDMLGGSLVSLRMGFDLWDEVFSVHRDGRERRFQTLADLQAYLSDLSDLPVASSSLLGLGNRFRIRAGLVIHSIAPDEQARVEDVIAGAQRPLREGQDRQEASVSLGRLIKLFYQSGHETKRGQELLSEWFNSGELLDAPH